MLRATCLLAVLSVAACQPDGPDDPPSLMFSVQPAFPYKKSLNLANEAYNSVQDLLLDEKPNSATDPLLHHMLVLGLVDVTAERLLNSPVSAKAKDVYSLAASEDLPLVYLDPVSASNDLEDHLNELNNALQPLVDLVKKVCVQVAEDTCDKLVQLELNRLLKDQAHLDLLKAVATLKEVRVYANQFLGLKVELKEAAEGYSGLGYALNNVDLLSQLALHLKESLLQARGGVSPKSKSG